MPMKKVQFWNKNTITPRFLKLQAYSVHHNFLTRFIDWHPQQYHFNHFHPFLIGYLWSKCIRNREWCNWTDFHLIHQKSDENSFTILYLSFNILSWSSVPPYQGESETEEDLFCQIFALETDCGPKIGFETVSNCSQFAFISIFDDRFLLIKKSSKQKMIQ